MERCARDAPLPPFIYRVHTHGDPFRRFEDEDTGEISSSFASDMHAWVETDAQMEMFGSISCPEDECTTISELVEVVANHLRKTQINIRRQARNEDFYLSPAVSLSGSFLWTMHTTCLKGQRASENQEAGLAIFDTSRIKARGVPLWRVKDLLTFFDSNAKFRGSDIGCYARKWASNAEEHLCWDLIPKEALVTFVPFERLALQSKYPKDIFLRPECF